MIVACTACPAQYSVPDAKIRGKKVRVTCKHCGAAFVVDASDEPLRQELNLEAALSALEPSNVSEDATHVMPKHDFSVHDQPTVIGEIPAAALEAERAASRRAAPPEAVPPAPVAPPEPPRALPEDVPEHPLDITDIASPQAKRASQGSLPPPASEPVPSLRTSRPSLPPQPSAELKTMLSASDITPPGRARSRATYGLLLLALLALVGLLILRSKR